jgi:hypothetical protein
MEAMMLLTVDGVAKAAAQYYKARMLTAQAKTNTNRKCVYKSDKYRCAIGAAMDEASAKSLGGSVDYLISAGAVEVLSDDEAVALGRIQKLHDSWCGFSNAYGPHSEEARIAEEKFLRSIDYRVAA